MEDAAGLVVGTKDGNVTISLPIGKEIVTLHFKPDKAEFIGQQLKDHALLARLDMPPPPGTFHL